jgi:hypothetical protein
MKITDVVKEDISRRGFLKGAGAAAMAGAAGGAGAGQYKSIDTLNKDPDSIQKIWVPRMSDLESRCYNILKSFIGAVSQSNPEYARVIQLIKVKISLGDKIFHQGNAANAQGTAQISPTGQKSFHSGTITLEATVFWDAPDDTLAFILGHECGHLVMLHGFSPASNARDNEMEADLIGASLAKNIGYNRARFFQFLFNLRADRLRNGSPNDPHLEPVDRVKFLKQRADFELSRNSIQYIDSLAQQLKQGLAEGMAQDEAEETNGWRAELVNQINYNTFEVKMTNTRSKESANFVVRPVDMISIGPTLQIETMDVHDLQTGQTESWTSDDPQPDGGIVYAIAMMFWDNKELQKKLWTIVDTHNTKGQDKMPGLDQRRSIGQEVDADAYIDSQEKTQDVMAKMKQGMAEDDVGEGIRVPAQQILGTKNRAKSAYYPTNVKPKVPKLDKPLTDQELARLAQLAGIKSK